MSQDKPSATQEFSPNTQVGAYRIEERIGAGGMGVVYRATDTKLGRCVALKVIRAELLHEEGLARFEREARVLASLNHPRIAAIHGMEESGGTQFLVLEYVPGPTLADRLRRARLSIREAIQVGRQIADAMEAAHVKGIIHRDLKPGNIKLSEIGQVKVLDFGLAKPIERVRPVSTDSTATVTESVTAGISIAGTAAYMSPEQACGKGLDSRTDIWSFGCVLYEMLSGKQTFQGRTLTEILAAVVEREPDWTALPAETPEAVRVLLKRCLRKDPAHRLRDIGDARIELEDALSAPASATAKPSVITRRTAISGVVGAAVGAAATGPFAISRWRGVVPRKLTQFAIDVPDNGVFIASFNGRVGISPDGGRVAFGSGLAGRAPFTLYVRSLNGLESQRIKEARSASVPFFSPDGHWVGFFSSPPPAAILKVTRSDDTPVRICLTEGFMGAAWAERDTIYWINQVANGLMSVPAAGGESKVVTKVDFAKGERIYRFPCAVPGRHVLFTATTADTATFDDARIMAFSPSTGQKKILLEGGSYPRHSSGHLLYAHSGKIMAVRFDPDRLRLEGQPFTVLEGLQMSRNTGTANFDVSASGDLIYIPGICEGGARTLVWVDRGGKAEPLPLPAKSYLHPRLSPDERRLAIEVEGANHDLYVYDFDRGVLANVTTDGVSHWPVWSPDGSRLSFRSGPMSHATMWQVPADRSRAPQQVPATGIVQSAESWSPDGRTIVYTATDPGSPPSIRAAHLDASREAEIVDKQKGPEGSPKFSPDGRWLAYCSMESGKPQAYVQAFPGPGPKIQISTDGGTDPVWKRTGGELYYRNGDSMIAVNVSTAPTFTAGRPRELWKGHYSHGMSTSCDPPGATSSNYDVTADGTRFLMVKDDDQDRTVSKQVVVVLGWADELSRMAVKS
jgi:serine/threonine protein kinase/Tol biopolymer transport system component